MHTIVLPLAQASEETRLHLQEDKLAFGKMQCIQSEGNQFIVLGIQKVDWTEEDVRNLGGTARKAVTTTDVTLELSGLLQHVKELTAKTVMTAFMEGWHLAGYTFIHYKKDAPVQQEIALTIHPTGYDAACSLAKTRANAVMLARDLCNEPANKLTPERYAERLEQQFADTGIQVEVISADELEEKGFHATAIVGKGSAHPPAAAILTYKNSTDKPTALVGKGITFDSGGTNVKTGSHIGEMKMDMGGSAAVVGAIKLIADLQLPVHVVAIIPMAINVAGSTAFLPSDVITYANGTTVEVGNTDAEGRLVLADGILYAQQLGAETIIDIATLTGTIGQALGLRNAGVFSNDPSNLWTYEALGRKSGDFVWPMPVIQEYETYLASDCADINNHSSSKFGGAITAALFLKHFVQQGNKWVHIDMANTVRPWKQAGYYVPGASGFGVRLLYEMICHETGQQEG